MKTTKRTIQNEQTTIGAPSVGAGGHIDLALGTFDRPGPNPEKDAERVIVPKEMVATQLATERPPVEDDDYVPSSVVELAKAAAEIAKMVPPDQVGKFYLRLKELADESVERQEITTIGEKEMIESKQKTKLVKMIREAMDDLDGPGIPGRDPNRKLASYPDIIKAHPEEFEDVKPARRYAAALEAGQTGLGKLEAMIDQLPVEDLDKLHKVAKDEYIDLFEEVMGDDIDAEDISDLKSLPADALYDMSDAYKFFFKAAFVLPTTEKFEKAYRSATRDAIAKVQASLKSLKIPSSVLSTVVFQLLGFSKRDPSAIKQKYLEASTAGEIRPEDVEMHYKQLMSKYAGVEASAKKDMVAARAAAAKDFVRDSLDAYSKMPLNSRKNLVIQAFEKMG